MHFDTRGLGHEQRHRVAQRNAGVGEASGIQNQALDLAPRRLQAVDQGALVIRLEGLEPRPGFGRQALQPGLDLGERGAPVDLGLSPAEFVQVGAIEEQDPHRVRFYNSWRRSRKSVPTR